VMFLGSMYFHEGFICIDAKPVNRYWAPDFCRNYERNMLITLYHLRLHHHGSLNLGRHFFS